MVLHGLVVEYGEVQGQAELDGVARGQSDAVGFVVGGQGVLLHLLEVVALGVFSDVSVVHNGQLTNYWNNRRVLENKGMRFMSECDSELIAVFLAEKMRNGATLEEGMKESLSGLDGVFTYFVATKDSLGMAKDTMAAKPLVLYESDDLVAMGSEEIAIRSILPQEIDTYDPFDGEVKVWQI